MVLGNNFLNCNEAAWGQHLRGSAVIITVDKDDPQPIQKPQHIYLRQASSRRRQREESHSIMATRLSPATVSTQNPQRVYNRLCYISSICTRNYVSRTAYFFILIPCFFHKHSIERLNSALYSTKFFNSLLQVEVAVVSVG